MALNSRPDWDTWALGVADAVARRGDCTRRQVGAVILDECNRVVSTGYNGSYAGGPSCLAWCCPRGRHHKTDPPGRAAGDRRYCACGGPWPCPDSSTPGEDYSNCHSIHAEANAILYARVSLVACTMYVTAEPCGDCLKLIRGAGVWRVVWRGADGQSHTMNYHGG